MTGPRRYRYERHEARTRWPTDHPHNFEPHATTREEVLAELERFRGRRDTALDVLREAEAQAEHGAPRWSMLAPAIRYRVTVAGWSNDQEVTP